MGWVHHTVMASTPLCPANTGTVGKKKEEEVRTPQDWNISHLVVAEDDIEIRQTGLLISLSW